MPRETAVVTDAVSCCRLHGQTLVFDACMCMGGSGGGGGGEILVIGGGKEVTKLFD